MFKMSFAIYRRPELTQEEFLRYWLDVHAKLAVKHQKALRIRKYVQMHGSDGPAARIMTDSRGSAPAHDGVCEIWWDSEADRLAINDTPEGREAGRIMREDELRFCDMTRSTVIFGEEHVIIDNTASAAPAAAKAVA